VQPDHSVAGVDLAAHRPVAVEADRSGGQTQDIYEVGVRRRDVAVHQQRDPPPQRWLIGRQTRQQVEQGLVTGPVALQKADLHGPDSFPRPSKVGQSGIEVDQVPPSEAGQVVCIEVEVGHGRAKLAEQPDPVEPVERDAVVLPPATGIAGWSQQPELLVVTQGAFGDTGTSRDVADAALTGAGAGHAVTLRPHVT